MGCCKARRRLQVFLSLPETDLPALTVHNHLPVLSITDAIGRMEGCWYRLEECNH